jgi:hypothetical protein
MFKRDSVELRVKTIKDLVKFYHERLFKAIKPKLYLLDSLSDDYYNGLILF